MFINQAFTNTLSGFVPNTTNADPNFGKCLQCAAIDRSRLKVSPVPARSSFCTQCFQQYCFDPNNPPSASELPGRKQDFVDPDPSALDKAEDFFSKHKVPILVGAGVGVLVTLLGICL